MTLGGKKKESQYCGKQWGQMLTCISFGVNMCKQMGWWLLVRSMIPWRSILKLTSKMIEFIRRDQETYGGSPLSLAGQIGVGLAFSLEILSLQKKRNWMGAEAEELKDLPKSNPMTEAQFLSWKRRKVQFFSRFSCRLFSQSPSKSVHPLELGFHLGGRKVFILSRVRMMWTF